MPVELQVFNCNLRDLLARDISFTKSKKQTELFKRELRQELQMLNYNLKNTDDCFDKCKDTFTKVTDNYAPVTTKKDHINETICKQFRLVLLIDLQKN